MPNQTHSHRTIQLREKEMKNPIENIIFKTEVYLTFLGCNNGMASTISPGKKPTVKMIPKHEFDSPSTQYSSNIT